MQQYYNPTNANQGYRLNEDQTPNIEVGYHHEWSPGVHTLFFATRLNDSLTVTNPFGPTTLTVVPAGVPTSVYGLTMQERFQDDLTLYSGELQQIWQTPEHNTIVGTRFQYGNFDIHNVQDTPSTLPFLFPPDEAADQNFSSLFRRISVYGYHQWQVFDPLQLIGGVTYDRITFPENFETAPVSDIEQTEEQFSPKAGLIFTPLEGTTLRFAYACSLAGASLDQSYQLEPSQVAGFVQSYRSLIPESVAGPVPGASFETYGFSLEQKFSTGTYLGVSGDLLYSDASPTVGTFDYTFLVTPFPVPSGLHENLNYREQSLLFTANQLLGKNWSVGARYRISDARFNYSYALPNGVLTNNFLTSQHSEAILNQVDLLAVYNHPCGFFAQADAHWYVQNNIDQVSTEPGDNFWQLNAFAGYRFLQRRAELTLGLLNLTDQNYNLNPLNLYNELPRSRTLDLSLRVNF